jgi:hypothetical protein
MRLLLALFICPCVYAVNYHTTDIFGSVGSDFTLSPRANYNFGVGQKFQFKHNPEKKVRWEITATYSYENNGNHGFLKTQYASHTSALGLVRSFHIPGRFTSFAAIHSGATTYTGQDKDPRAFVSGTGGFGIHIHYRYTLTFTETYSKVETKPMYWTTGVGLQHGWWSVTANYNRTSGDYKCHLNFGMSLSALLSGEHKEHPRIFHTTP